jgi:serine/threonine-protein kinase
MLESLRHYKIIDRLGVGAIGDVFRARDTRLGRTVAIEAVGRDVDARADLVRAAEAVTKLSHPNIIALFDVVEEAGDVYLVFEYVPGDSLKAVISGRPLNPRRAVDFATQLADALAEAHATQFVHRHLKPETVVVTPKGNTKILDFGLSRWSRRCDEQPNGREEQGAGSENDHQVDIGALGAILFEMLTGKTPADHPRPSSGRPSAAPPVPSAVNQAVPSELDAIVAKAMSSVPAERYAAAATMAADLRAAGATLDARAPTQLPTTHAPARSKNGSPKWPVVVTALVIVALLVWWALLAG